MIGLDLERLAETLEAEGPDGFGMYPNASVAALIERVRVLKEALAFRDKVFAVYFLDADKNKASYLYNHFQCGVVGVNCPPTNHSHAYSAWLAGTRVQVGDGKGQSAASLVVEAFGDAVIPQIPEAIGRAILRTESALAAIYRKDAA